VKTFTEDKEITEMRELFAMCDQNKDQVVSKKVDSKQKIIYCLPFQSI